MVLVDYQSYGKEIHRTGALVSKLSLEYGLSISRLIMKEIQWMESDTPLLRNIRIDGVPVSRNTATSYWIRRSMPQKLQSCNVIIVTSGETCYTEFHKLDRNQFVEVKEER